MVAPSHNPQAQSVDGLVAVPVGADVSTPSGAQAPADGAVAAFGTVDVLVDNAGIPLVRPAEEITPDEWARTVATNRFSASDIEGPTVPGLPRRLVRHRVERADGRRLVTA